MTDEPNTPTTEPAAGSGGATEHAHAPATTERPAGYVAKCSMRGSSSSQSEEDPPIERYVERLDGPRSPAATQPDDEALAAVRAAGAARRARLLAHPEGDAQALARNTAEGVDVPHTPGDLGTAEPRRRKPRDRALIAVVTGEGKGKSTSAFGMLLRAWNRDYRCAVVQFVKSGKWKVGEQRAAEALGDIDWFKMGDGWSWISKDITESAALAQAGWERVKEWIAEERYEFLVLDEFTYPMKWGWIDTAEVIDVLTNRPGFQHIVITGRDAPEALCEAADLVSRVELVKHPMAAGIRGQQGIEW